MSERGLFVGMGLLALASALYRGGVLGDALMVGAVVIGLVLAGVGVALALVGRKGGRQ